MTGQTSALVKELTNAPEQFKDDLLFLKEFFNGASVQLIRPLLCNGCDRVGGCGAWLASELGAKCIDLVPELLGLLSDSQPRTRHDVLTALRLMSNEGDETPFCGLLNGLADESSFNRTRTMEFIYSLEVIPRVSEGARPV